MFNYFIREREKRCYLEEELQFVGAAMILEGLVDKWLKISLSLFKQREGKELSAAKVTDQETIKHIDSQKEAPQEKNQLIHLCFSTSPAQHPTHACIQ